MKVKHLLVKIKDLDEYLLLGYSYDIATPPSDWQLPVIPNEYGEHNFEQVVASNLYDDFGLSLLEIKDTEKDSDIAFVEVEGNLNYPAIYDDPDELRSIEFRNLVSKEQLKEIAARQPNIFGTLHL